MDDYLITLDVDWAPDFVIEYVADLLKERSVPSTWFVTHRSPAIDELFHHRELFELGIHPNFMPSSTQGTSPEAILSYCMTIVPGAKAVRTHGLIQSTNLLDLIMRNTSIEMDFSLYLPRAKDVEPVKYWWDGRSCLRVPYIWEDDFEMQHDSPLWQMSNITGLGHGLKVLAFHPIHIYLNSRSIQKYQNIKRDILEEKSVAPSQLDIHIEEEPGTQTFFLDILDYLRKRGKGILARDIPSPTPA